MTALGEEGKLVKELVKAKARTAADYDRDLAVAIITLRDLGTPVSIAEKLAKGKVFEALYKKMIAEESLKAHYSRMSQLKTQLEGLRSINKYLSVMDSSLKC